MTKKNNNKDNNNNNNNNKKMTVKKKKLGKLAMTDQTIRELETCIEVRKKKRKSAQTKMRREREPPKTKLGNREMKRDEDEVVLVVFVSRGFFLSFFLCVSDSVAACIFFLRLIRFHARLSLFIYLSLTKMRSFFSFVAFLQKCAGNETGIRFEPAGSSASKVLRK